MLITFSGIVGSGKSTNARQAHRLLIDLGCPAVYLRFRFLTWGRMLARLDEGQSLSRPSGPQPPAGRAAPGAGDRTSPSVPAEPSGLKPCATSAAAPAQEPGRRLRAQRPRRLTGARALGYLARILAFRLFVATRGRGRVVIVDRFFYDNLAHYALGSRRERRLFRLLARALPVPDLAILLMADPSTILTRRPNYAADHIARLHAAYRQVAREFPGIRVIQTDRLDGLTDAVAGHVRSVVRSELARAARVIGADLT